MAQSLLRWVQHLHTSNQHVGELQWHAHAWQSMKLHHKWADYWILSKHPLYSHIWYTCQWCYYPQKYQIQNHFDQSLSQHAYFVQALFKWQGLDSPLPNAFVEIKLMPSGHAHFMCPIIMAFQKTTLCVRFHRIHSKHLQCSFMWCTCQ